MYQKLIPAGILICTLIAAAVAQSDPDPNSPTPAITGIGSETTKPGRGAIIVNVGDRLRINVEGIELEPGERQNAFRPYLYQKSGRLFELRTESVEEIGKRRYALRVVVRDVSAYYGEPIPDGESLVFITWRGMASSPVRINVGRAGSPIATPEFLKITEIKDSPVPEYVGYRWSGDRIRFLEQATFGPSADLDQRIRRIGIRTWLAEQFEAPYPTIPYPVIPQMPTTPPSTCTQVSNPTCYRERYTAVPLQQWFYKEAYYGDAQLRHRVAWSLSQIWVTSAATIPQSSHMIAYHKVLSKNAFGNYRDLMVEMTLNPAMGDYLDMIRSTKLNPNENYAREILQLFSIGLFRLNMDGSLIRDGNNDPIPTYDQDDVNNFSKVFTGWANCNSAECPNAEPGIPNFKDPMLLNPSNHDVTAKTLLDYPNAVGRDVSACTDCSTPALTTAYANASLQQAIDNIFYHPNTPPFVSRLLIQHLVTSDPSGAYVERVANIFANNGQGVRGDLKAVVRAILLDPEARGDIKTAPRYGKLREPVQLLTGMGRLFPAKSWDGTATTDGGLGGPMSRLGQNAFYSPSVFNYYAPEYVVPGTTLNAPEFALLNSSFAINRTNFLYVLIFDGFTPNVTDSLRGISLDLTDATNAAASDPSGTQLLDLLNYRMFHGAIEADHRNAILTAVLAVPESNPALRAKQAIYLAAASSQYQVQR